MAFAAAALTVAALLYWCASSRADVTVVSVGGGFSQTVNLSDLSGPDVNDGAYSDISAGGGPPETVTVTNGYSLRRLFDKGLQSVPAFGAVEVPVPGGRSVILNTSQATIPGAYADGPPVVWQDASGTHFLVPASAESPGELVTGDITIKLYSGEALAVGIYAPSNVIVDKPVDFHSTVGGAPGPFDYSWQFGDNSGSSLALPTHTYTTTGVYTVYLTVNAGGDSLGQSTPMTITVGEPPPAPVPQGGVVGGTGTGTGGSGTGQGSGAGAGGTSAGTSTQPTATVARVKHARHRAARPPRPTGPVISGIAINYVGQPLTASAAAAAGAAAARAAHARATTDGLDIGMWIWFGVLSLLFGGAVLEWAGPRRARLALSEAP